MCRLRNIQNATRAPSFWFCLGLSLQYLSLCHRPVFTGVSCRKRGKLCPARNKANGDMGNLFVGWTDLGDRIWRVEEYLPDIKTKGIRWTPCSPNIFSLDFSKTHFCHLFRSLYTKNPESICFQDFFICAERHNIIAARGTNERGCALCKRHDSRSFGSPWQSVYWLWLSDPILESGRRIGSIPIW